MTPEESDSSSSPQAALFLPIYLFLSMSRGKKFSVFVLFLPKMTLSHFSDFDKIANICSGMEIIYVILVQILA